MNMSDASHRNNVVHMNDARSSKHFSGGTSVWNFLSVETHVPWIIHMCDMTHYVCEMTHLYVWHDSFICVTWFIHMCDMTHSYVWHDALRMWHDSFICVTWLIHMCDMTHSYVWHDSFICVTRLIHMCDMTHSYVWHDSSSTTRGEDLLSHNLVSGSCTYSARMTWLIDMCDMIQ